jgi:prepilin-type N-terminal cleavage/methylation domain-containing protein
MQTQDTRKRGGFTLTELLVVIAIVLIVSAATIPVALGVLGDQEISDAASTVQAAFTLSRDTAVKDVKPVGLRLLPDPMFNRDPSAFLGGQMASNRLLALQVPNNYSEGSAIPATTPPVPVPQSVGLPVNVIRIGVTEKKFTMVAGVPIPDPPTGWYDNIRQGDKIRFNDAGALYVVAGPNQAFIAAGNVINPERYVNADLDPAQAGVQRSLPTNAYAEYLYLVNGRDDDGDGYTDESYDGIDNNNDGIFDPGFNGIDDDGANGIDDPAEMLFSRIGGVPRYDLYDATTGLKIAEYEPETWINRLPMPVAVTPFTSYSIARRPLPAAGSREISLPPSIVIDLTTSNLGYAFSERSRVPLDPATGYVDLLIYPNGQIVPSTPYGNFAAMADFPNYLLWLAEREEIFEPEPYVVDTSPTAVNQCYLPMPRNTPNYTLQRFLEGQRRIVVLSPNSGHAAVSVKEDFHGQKANAATGSTGATTDPGGATRL